MAKKFILGKEREDGSVIALCWNEFVKPLNIKPTKTNWGTRLFPSEKAAFNFAGKNDKLYGHLYPIQVEV